MIHDYDDGRGRYPDLLSVRAPAGLREQVRQAAQAERLPMANTSATPLQNAWRERPAQPPTTTVSGQLCP